MALLQLFELRLVYVPIDSLTYSLTYLSIYLTLHPNTVRLTIRAQKFHYSRTASHDLLLTHLNHQVNHS